MATYTYKCLDCENVFEIKATIQEKEEDMGDKFICPKCQSENLKQEFSVSNFVKNIFAGDSTGGCCSGGDVCDISCKPDDNNSSGCGDKKRNGGCCG